MAPNILKLVGPLLLLAVACTFIPSMANAQGMPSQPPPVPNYGSTALPAAPQPPATPLRAQQRQASPEEVVLALFRSIVSVLAAASNAAQGVPSIVNFGYDGASRWYLYGTPATTGSWHSDTLAAVLSDVALQQPLDSNPSDAASWLVRATVSASADAFDLDVQTTDVQQLLNALTGGFSLAPLGGVLPQGGAELRLSADRATGALTQLDLVVAVPLFGGDCTATELAVSLNSSSAEHIKDFVASLHVSCDVAAMSDATVSVSTVGGVVEARVSSTLSFLGGLIAITDLSLSTDAHATYLAGTGSGSVAGHPCSVSLNTSTTSSGGAKGSRKTALSLALPAVNLGQLVSGVASKLSGSDTSLPDFFPSSFTFPSIQLSTPDLSAGVFALTTLADGDSPSSGSGLFADIVFDRSGLLTADVGLPDDLDIGTLLGKLGLALPFDTSSLLSIKAPSFSTTSPRAQAAVVEGVRAAVGSSTAFTTGTSFSFGIDLPNLSLPTLPCVMKVKDAVGSVLSNLNFEIDQDVPLVPGYLTLSGVQLHAISGVGLQALCAGDLLGLGLDANITIPTAPGAKPSVHLHATGVNLASLVTKVWSSAPDVVVSTLQGITFPAFMLDEDAGVFFAQAGPVEGITVALAIDHSGLRYIRLNTGSACLGIGEVISGLGLGGSVEVPDVFTICHPFLEVVPSVKNQTSFTLPNGTTLEPSESAGFALSIPDIGIDSIDAELDVHDGAATIHVAGSFPVLNGWATFTDLLISNTSKTHFYAAVTFSVPDLNLDQATCSVEYDAEGRTFTFTVEGHASFIFNAIAMDALSISLSMADGTRLHGSATGALAGYSGTLGFSFSLPSKSSGVPAVSLPPQFSLTIPEVDVAKALRAVGPSAADLLPSFLLDLTLPSFTMASYSVQAANNTPAVGVYSVSVGPTASGIGADLVFDRSGVLVANASMDGSLDLGSALQKILPGAALPFDISGLVIISDPVVSVVSPRAASLNVPTSAPAGTYLGFGLQIPPLLGDNTVLASMLVADGNGTKVVTIKLAWTGSFTPVPHVELNGASVIFQTGTGLVVKANGNILNTPVSASLVVADKASKDQGAPALNFTGTATDVSASNILGTLFPETPRLILTILNPIRFAEIDFTYDGSNFGVSASPDLSGVPGLGQILSYLGFKQNDIKIRPSLADGGSIEIAITKTWPLDLGSPFVGTSYISFGVSVAEEGADTQISCAASFQATMALPFLDPPNVAFNLGAAVSYDSTAPPPSISFILSASATATSTPFHIKGFPWIGIGFIGGSVGLQPIPELPFVNIRNIDFAAKGVILDVDVQVAVLYDQPHALFAIQFGLQHLDLQKMLNKLSVDVDLGPFNVIVDSAFFSFADQPAKFGPISIPAGLQLAANMTFLSIPFGFNAQVGTSGFALAASARDVTDAPIMQEVFREVQSVIDDLKLGFKIADEIQLHYVSIDLELTASQQSFAFDFSATLFGVDLSVNGLKLDPKSVPWSQIVDTLKDTILKPLTAACTKDSYARSSQPVSTCPSGYEQQGAICYPSCPSDWQYGSHGVLNTCYQNCPPGYHDDGVGGTGLTCSYVGCDPNTQVQDEIGGLCYDKCAAGYTYYGSRCYQICAAGYSDSSVFTSCSTWSCNPGDDDNGAGTCYPRCRDGYHSNGLTMCIQDSCPGGYRNDPLSCFRDADTKGKGCCCVNFRFWDNGCCGNCDSGYTDTGCTCYRGPDTIWKSTYDRGTGYPKGRTYVKSSYPAAHPVSSIHSFAKKTSTRGSLSLGCPANTDSDGALLCYDKCRAGYTGKSFLCWQDSCPPGLIDCGTYCAPAAAGSCANFVGAAWQNCQAVYPSSGRRAALASAASEAAVIEVEKLQQEAEAVAATFKALHTRRPAECDEASGAAETKPECFCVGRAVGTYANPFDAAQTSFVLCNGDGAAHVHECAAGLVFDPAVGLCDLAPEAKVPPQQPRVPDCLSKPDGSYVLRAGDRASVYKCVAGSVVTQPPCSEGQVWNGALGRCVDGPSSAETTTQQQPAPCTSADCFCADKPDGKYADVLGGDMAKYIRCLGGKGRVAACPPYTMWHHAEATCADAPRNGTVLAAACKDVECFCIGRPDGAYADPWGPSDGASSGIICAQQYATPLTCDVDFVFDAAASPPCQPKDGTRAPRRVGGKAGRA